ncbi:hypothetical protein [Haloarcula sediminis]|uniref:hypothetical protein n=1 Tax=Haloarcula sediminis TaxID=3111777 RepID=UPI002D79AEC8|nr:hypothetical protein [Haloarcula sp. CK38]
MSRKGLLLVAALATAAVLVPTGAAPFGLTGTDDVSGDIELRPADGPNGNYALLNENDELELLLTGANPAMEGEGVSSNAVTPIPRVFTMTYTGDQYARVWLTDDAEDVRFYRGDDSDDSLERRANSVVLGPSETVTVGLLVDTRGDHDVEQADTFSVNAEVADGDDDDDGYTPPTPTPTPTETPAPTTPTETSDGGVETPEGDDSTDGTPAAGGTPTDAETPVSTPEAESSDGGDGLIELGGLGLGPLVVIGGGLLGLLAALAGYRQFV